MARCLGYHTCQTSNTNSVNMESIRGCSPVGPPHHRVILILIITSSCTNLLHSITCWIFARAWSSGFYDYLFYRLGHYFEASTCSAGIQTRVICLTACYRNLYTLFPSLACSPWWDPAQRQWWRGHLKARDPCTTWEVNLHCSLPRWHPQVNSNLRNPLLNLWQHGIALVPSQWATSLVIDWELLETCM